ncbi:unnamed protein product [Sphacelaria rigidula]
MFREILEETGVRLYDAADADSVNEETTVPELSFPSPTRGKYVWDLAPGASAISLAVSQLAKGCTVQGNDLGFDCEWEPALGGAIPNPVSTVQLSLPDGTAYCFHLQGGQNRTTPSNFPAALRQLLEDPSIAKVGVNVNSDASLLERDYGVDVGNTVDVRTHARECWVETPSRSLAGMVGALIGKELFKDPTIRFSRWSSGSLTNEQEIERLKDPIRTPAPTTLPVGTKVRLYSNNHANCVGLGEVQGDENASQALRRWRPRSWQRLKGVIVVNLTEALVPAAFIPHKNAPSVSGVKRVTLNDVFDSDNGSLVLWDVAYVRLARDLTPRPPTPAPSATKSTSAAYDDDAEFFAADPPCHVVRSPDDEDLGEDGEDSDGHDDGDLGLRRCACHTRAVNDSNGDINIGQDANAAKVVTCRRQSSVCCHCRYSTLVVFIQLSEERRRMLKVRLDIFHALQRLSRLLKKSHGAFRPFMARLRDACFIVNLADNKEARLALKAQGMKPEEVATYKKKNWTFFLRNCRRLVPNRERLSARFDSVIDQFRNVVDAKSGEVLLRPKAMDAINLLRKHIEAGCLSDPDGVPLYYATGKSAAGITTRRCVRGTNSTEGYHRYLRRLLLPYCASPSLAHSMLLEFNHRWNIKMAVKNRDLRKDIGGCFDQFDIEIIQRETSTWYTDSPLLSEWVSALDAADTGERSGLSKSIWGGAMGSVPADFVGDQGMVQEPVPLPRLTLSAKQYARMMDVGMPETPVHNAVERRKFAAELDAYLFIPGDRMGRLQQHQSINFDKWAVEWNNHCESIESGRTEWEAVYRKTSKQLQSHYEQFKQRANATNTIFTIRQTHAELRGSSQEPGGEGLFAGLVGSVVPPAVPRSRSEAGIGGGEGGGAAGGAGPSAGNDAVMNEVGRCGDAEMNSEPTPKKPKGPSRAPQQCRTCGHCKQRGGYKRFHPTPREKGAMPQCNVPLQDRRPQSCRNGKRRCRGGDRAWSRCDCEKCRADDA